jgi:acetyltransferase-like isoleucine patch superfamily enzyme
MPGIFILRGLIGEYFIAMKKLILLLASSEFVSAIATSLIYAFYAVILGVSLFPSLWLLWFCHRLFPSFGSLHSIACFSIACGFAIMLFFIAGTLVIGTTVRILSIGIKAGKYPMASLTMVRWLIYSGLYNLAGRLILEYVPMTFITNLFFRILGAKIGKNVQINSWFLNDAYLLSIGDNVVIGGKTDVSCHTFEKGFLILKNVTIGRDTLIGQRCYISPGVTIGERCIIGQYAFLRKNTVVPDRTTLSAIAGLPVRTIAQIEKSTTGPAEQPQ